MSVDQNIIFKTNVEIITPILRMYRVRSLHGYCLGNGLYFRWLGWVSISVHLSSRMNAYKARRWKGVLRGQA